MKDRRRTMKKLFLDESENLRWGLCGVVVLLAHLVPAVAWISWEKEQVPLPPPAAMMIDLEPLPTPPAPAPQPKPPEPEPEPPRPQPKPRPKTVKPPPVASQPEVALPEPEPVSQPTTPSEVQKEATPTPTPPSSPPTGPVSSKAAINYQQRLLAHLERHRHYPRGAQLRRQQGVAQLRFIVERNGRVLEYEIVEGSGYSALDQEVLAMIKRAQPLPPIPPELEKDQMELVVPVEFSLQRMR